MAAVYYEVVNLLLLIHCLLLLLLSVGPYVGYLFCNAVHSVRSSSASILLSARDLIPLL